MEFKILGGETTTEPALIAHRIEAVAAAALIGALGCTTLGPMPATTAISAVPATRPDVELQIGGIPGYYLSSAVAEEPEGATVLQALLAFEPDELIGAPGLIVGGRIMGDQDSGTYPEGLLGYRTALDSIRRFSLGVFGYASNGSASHDRASYEATRAGLEATMDIAATPEQESVSLHVFAGGSLTGLWASGEYCLDAEGKYGVDCGDGPVTLTSADAGRLLSRGFGRNGAERRAARAQRVPRNPLRAARRRRNHAERGRRRAGKTVVLRRGRHLGHLRLRRQRAVTPPQRKADLTSSLSRTTSAQTPIGMPSRQQGEQGMQCEDRRSHRQPIAL